MKKRFLPKDVKELGDICYGNDNDRKKRYESYVDSKIIDPERETYAKEILKGFGESQKIPREDTKTPDYEIKKSKIVYEITSIQISEDEKVTQDVRPRHEQDFIEDVDKGIEHALGKDYSNYPSHLKGVVIFMDEIISSLTKYGKHIADPSIIKQTIFGESNIDFMILAPIPHSTNKELPHVAYVKNNELFNTFRDKLPGEFEIININS